MQAAFQRYQDERRIEVLRLQSAARNSLEWFEQVERYLPMPPTAIRLFPADPQPAHQPRKPAQARPGLSDPRRGLVSGTGGRHAGAQPMFAPFRLRGMALENRVVVSPMAQYKAVDGCPTDWHFAHYAERAKGGAGLVYTEMTCVSPQGRITPGCPGLYAPEHEAAWKRLTDFVHAETRAKLCCQIGHAGRKASVQVPWEEDEAPLTTGAWERWRRRPCPGRPATPPRAT
jgi:anthraniloyl-CoA monooxygenase